MLAVLLAAVGALAVIVAAFSRRLRPTVVTPPLAALVLGIVLGPQVLDVVSITGSERIGVLHTATRLLLAVGLMAVALRYPFHDLRRQLGAVTLLVLVVMPLMAATVAVAAGTLLGASLAVALALGAALAPTDPVLAAGVVTGEPAEAAVPARLRELLSLESGANDGLALPLVAVAVSLASSSSFASGLARGSAEVVFGAAAGALLGAAAAWLMTRVEEHHEMEEGPRLFFTLALAAGVLGAVELVGGNAVLGVFAAGLAFNRVVTARDRSIEARIDEAMNSFLVLPVFVLLGVVLPWDGWMRLGGPGLGFVVAVLLLRRLPWVMLLARPLRVGWRDAAWLGWFGPIGVAAVFYIGHLHEQGVTDPVVWHAGTLVVAASVLVHGVTQPLGRQLATDPGSSGDGAGRTAGPGSASATRRA